MNIRPSMEQSVECTSANQTNHVNPSAKSTSTSLEHTSVPRTKETFSDFDDSCCGEPLFAQHLFIDFTPTEDDNDFVQKKCCDFWTFIKSMPQIQNLMVLPEKNVFSKSTDPVHTSQDIQSKAAEEKTKPEPRTAVSMLEIIDNKGLITRTFEAKLQRSSCTLGSREYIELEETTQQKRKRPVKCKCVKKPCWGPCCVPARPSKLKTMVRDMQDWDTKHPKSMDPPGHPPSLQPGILQKRKFPADT